MDDFQKQLRRLRGNQAFAAAFNKKRAEAEVAFQIRRLRESKGWSQKDLAKGGLQPTGDIGGRTRRIQESFTSAFASYRTSSRR
jgi:hypothetical protein